MTLVIPDEVLKQAGLTERDALIEFACRLFETGKLTLRQAGVMAGLERMEMESELAKRQIAVYRPTIEDVESDLRTLENFRGPDGDRRQ